MEYQTGSHTKYKLEYHFVWATKYRYQVLTGDIKLRLRELIRQTCESLEVQIVKGAVSVDHVHILVSCPPSVAPAELMKRIKGRSSRMLMEEYGLLKKRYWGRHLWSRGYFCVSVGQFDEELVKAYLEHHGEKNGNGIWVETPERT
jgi:putative transposase